MASRKKPSIKEFPLGDVFHLIEPGPVVLLATSSGGKNNVMAMSWHLMMEFTPPLIGCVVSPGDYSYNALVKNRQCVIAIPTFDILEKTVKAGNCSGEDTDKFAEIGLTPLPAKKVKAPLVGECLANLECKVVDSTLADKYAFFILEVVQAWIDPGHKEKRFFHHNGEGTFRIDGRTINMKKKMTKWKDMV